MKNSDKPAYPNERTWLDIEGASGAKDVIGLSKREMFAMAAMQGILASRELQICLIQDQKHDGTTAENYIAVYAVKQADELLKQLDTNP